MINCVYIFGLDRGVHKSWNSWILLKTESKSYEGPLIISSIVHSRSFNSADENCLF